MGDSDKRYPVLDTPQAWQEYLTILGMEAYDAEHPGMPWPRREEFRVAIRTKMADAAQTITSELELAKEEP